MNKWGITYLEHKDSWYIEPRDWCPQFNVVYRDSNVGAWVFVECDDWLEAFDLGQDLIVEYINIGEN